MASRSRREREDFIQRVLITIGLTLFILVLAWLMWQTVEVFLLLFGGLLVAVFLHSVSNLLSHYTLLNYRWALAVLIVAIVALIVLTGWLLGPDVQREFSQVQQELPQRVEELQDQLQQYGWGQWVLDQIPEPSELVTGQRPSLLARATGIFSTTLTVLTHVGFVLATGVFFAVSPEIYKRGLVSLFPHRYRDRMSEVLEELGATLSRWLLGQFAAMLAVGVMSTLGFWFIGVPLAIPLGIFAGIMEFVPLIGPPLGFIPAFFLALTVNPTQALYVLLLYIVVQAAESYLITPLVQKEAIEMPPVLTITSEVLLGFLFGFLGIVLATPLMATGLILTKMLYVEDVLGDPVELPGDDSEEEAAKHREHKEPEPVRQPAEAS